MRLRINGEDYEVDSDPAEMLLWVLRDELGLTGTKYGCGIGMCGACTVHIDGQAMRSCITRVDAATGREVRTIEGLAARADDGAERLHPVQQAFLDAQVPQCGWCMSGQMMTAAALLESTPQPSEQQIVAAMGQNYCRCGCYTRIRTAVAAAAELAAEERV